MTHVMHYSWKYIKQALKAGMMVVLLGGCSSMHMDFNWAKPTHLDMTPPEGTPEYEKGFVDGCNSGWKAYTNTFNKVWGGFEQDPELAQNPVYYQVWKDAYAYCAAYANSTSEHGLMTNDGKGGGVLDIFGTYDSGPTIADDIFGPVGATTMPEWRNPFEQGVSMPEYRNPF